MAKLGKAGWGAIVSAVSGAAALATPTPQSWVVAVPLWGLTAWCVRRWWLASHATHEDDPIDVTPEQVCRPFDGLTSVQAQAVFDASFKGKRMVVAGTIADVSKFILVSPETAYSMDLAEHLGDTSVHVMFFFRRRAGRRLEHLESGAPVRVEGTISEASRQTLTLMNCELRPLDNTMP